VAKARRPYELVRDVICAVDFVQRNGNVSVWTTGYSERQNNEVPGRSFTVSGVAQWLGRRSVAGGLALIYA